MKEHTILIKAAYSSYRKKNYADCAVLLEKVISDGTRDPYPHFLLAVTYLLSGKLQKVESALKNIKLYQPDFRPAVQLEAFLVMKSAENFEAALSRYLDALQRFPDDRYIIKAIKSLRKTANFDEFQKKARLGEYVEVPAPGSRSVRAPITRPVCRRRFALKKPLITAAVLLVCCALCVVLYVAYRDAFAGLFLRTEGALSPHPDSRAVDIVVLERGRHDLINRINKERQHVFYYSNDEIYNDFTTARALIKQEKHNDALVLINKISASNANFTVKEKADFLRKFILDVDGREASGVSYGDVAKRPYLYRGMIVQWQGKTANLRRKEGKMYFNLLIEYRDNGVFSGIVDAYSQKDYEKLTNGDIVDVRAMFVNTIGGDDRVYLVVQNIIVPGKQMGEER